MRQVSDVETVKRERVDCCKKVVSDFDPVDGLPICPFHGKQPRALPSRQFKIPRWTLFVIAAAGGFLSRSLVTDTAVVQCPAVEVPQCAECAECPQCAEYPQCAECPQCVTPQCAECADYPQCPVKSDCSAEVSNANQSSAERCQRQLHAAAQGCDAAKVSAVGEATAAAEKTAKANFAQKMDEHAADLRALKDQVDDAERRGAESASFAFTFALVVIMLALWLLRRERQNHQDARQELEQVLEEVARLQGEIKRKDGLMTQALETLKEQAKVLREEHSFEVFNLAAEDNTPAQFVKAAEESLSEIDSPLVTHRPTFSYTPLGVEDDKENSEPVKRKPSVIDREAIALERHLSRLPRKSLPSRPPAQRRFSEK